MIKKSLTYLFLMLLMISSVVFFKCSSSDSPPPEVQAVSRLVVLDYGNAGNGADLFVSFDGASNQDDIDGYQLVLVKSGSDRPDQATIENLRPSSTVQFLKSNQPIEQQLTANVTDIEGDLIANGQAYDAYIYSRPTEDGAIGGISNRFSITLEDKPYYEVKTFSSAPPMEALSYYEDGNYLMGPGPNNTLHKVNLDGSHSRFAEGLATPYGGGFDQATGTFYISNFDTNEVFAFDTEGNRELVTTGLNGPTGIAVNSKGEIFINNYWSNIITRINAQGQRSTFSRDEQRLIQGPDGLVFVNDELYCINFDNARIMRVADDGTVSLFATIPGQETGYLAYGNDNFYAASLSLRKIFRINRSGQYEEIAGSGSEVVKDGPAPLAGFIGPNGIVVVNDTVYVSDRQSLRMIIRHE